MRNIPNVLVLDDFFDNPDEVRELALSLPYYRPARTNYPGERTAPLQQAAPEHYKLWEERFMDMFGGCHDGPWGFSTQFQRIPTVTDDPEANEGWTHCDPGEDIGGVIYLNPAADPSAGTTFVRPRPGTAPQTNSHLKYRNDYYGGRNNISTEEYVIAKAFNNQKYQDDIIVANNYNRFVAFNCKKPHKQTTFGKADDYRLTQVFFARKL